MEWKAHFSATELGYLIPIKLIVLGSNLLEFGQTSMEMTQWIPCGSMSGRSMVLVLLWIPNLHQRNFISTKEFHGFNIHKCVVKYRI